MKKIFQYLSILLLMTITIGYQNCSKVKDSNQKKSSSSPSITPYQANPFSQSQANIQIISAEIKADTNQVRVLGSCDLPRGKKGEISGEITKTPCSACQPLSLSAQCVNDQFELSGTLSSQLSVTSENDTYTASVVMSVIDNSTQNKESSVKHSLAVSIESGGDSGGTTPPPPDRFVLSVNDACSLTTSWAKPTENCEASDNHGGSTKCSSGFVRTTPWQQNDLDHGGRASCRTVYLFGNYHNDNNDSLAKEQYATSRIYMYCPIGYSTGYDEANSNCKNTKTSNNSKSLDLSVSSCSVTCTKDTGEEAPTPPDSFPLAVNQTCSLTTSWTKPTENCEETSQLDIETTKCSETVYTYPWTKNLDYGAKAKCQTSYTAINKVTMNMNQESTSQSQSASSRIYIDCPSGYDVSSHLCWDYKTNQDESSMDLSVSSCTATCTKKQEEEN